jgi:hypothetical protein
VPHHSGQAIIRQNQLSNISPYPLSTTLINGILAFRDMVDEKWVRASPRISDMRSHACPEHQLIFVEDGPDKPSASEPRISRRIRQKTSPG